MTWKNLKWRLAYALVFMCGVASTTFSIIGAAHISSVSTFLEHGGTPGIIMVILISFAIGIPTSIAFAAIMNAKAAEKLGFSNDGERQAYLKGKSLVIDRMVKFAKVFHNQGYRSSEYMLLDEIDVIQGEAKCK